MFQIINNFLLVRPERASHVSIVFKIWVLIFLELKRQLQELVFFYWVKDFSVLESLLEYIILTSTLIANARSNINFGTKGIKVFERILWSLRTYEFFQLPNVFFLRLCHGIYSFSFCNEVLSKIVFFLFMILFENLCLQFPQS